MSMCVINTPNASINNWEKSIMTVASQLKDNSWMNPIKYCLRNTARNDDEIHHTNSKDKTTRWRPRNYLWIQMQRICVWLINSSYDSAERHITNCEEWIHTFHGKTDRSNDSINITWYAYSSKHNHQHAQIGKNKVTDQQQQHWIKVTINSSHLLLSLVFDTLDYFQIKQGKFKQRDSTF